MNILKRDDTEHDVEYVTRAEAEAEIQGALDQVRQWKYEFENLISHLKYAEQNHNRSADDLRLKAETIQHERMGIEQQLYKAGLTK